MALLASVVALVACSSNSATSDTQSTAAAGTTTTTASTVTTSDTAGQPAVQEIIDVGGGQLLGMAASEDAVWAISFDNGTLVKIDPSTNDVSASVRISQAGSVLSNDGDVWVARYGFGTSGGGIDRVDAASAAKVASIAAGDVCCDLTFGDDLLWLLDAGGDAAVDRSVEQHDRLGVPRHGRSQRPFQRRVRRRLSVGVERHDAVAPDRPADRTDRRFRRRWWSAVRGA
jgi:hypothetical protein